MTETVAVEMTMQERVLRSMVEGADLDAHKVICQKFAQAVVDGTIAYNVEWADRAVRSEYRLSVMMQIRESFEAGIEYDRIRESYSKALRRVAMTQPRSTSLFSNAVESAKASEAASILSDMNW